ncbi:MAG: hypothetical protein COA78_17295 [Blastopirellula sp.]|nr:MAG: hypothetical protein COA78_17295 [Blastopirellula sp.]
MNQRVRSNPYYAGRVYCLFQNFNEFNSWAIKAGYKSGLILDRIDNQGPYSQENSQWLSRSEHTLKTAVERRKFSPSEIRQIRAAYASGISSYKLGPIWGYSQKGIINIVNRKAYADVK